MKKAQIEIIGLAVIVIILAVGLIIALMFILRPKIDTLEDQRQNIRATVLLNSLIDTNENLEDISNEKKVKDIIKECYSDQNPISACERALKAPILNKLFKNQDYTLEIKQDFGDFVRIPSRSSLTSCPDDQIITDPVVIVATPRMTVRLMLCSPKF